MNNTRVLYRARLTYCTAKPRTLSPVMRESIMADSYLLPKAADVIAMHRAVAFGGNGTGQNVKHPLAGLTLALNREAA